MDKLIFDIDGTSFSTMQQTEYLLKDLHLSTDLLRSSLGPETVQNQVFKDENSCRLKLITFGIRYHTY